MVLLGQQVATFQVDGSVAVTLVNNGTIKAGGGGGGAGGAGGKGVALQQMLHFQV